MALSVQEKITSREKRELEKLKRSKRRTNRGRWALFGFFSIIAASVVLAGLIRDPEHRAGSFDGALAVSAIESRYVEHSRWLQDHMGSGSAALFQLLSSPVIKLSGSLISESSGGAAGSVGKLSYQMCDGLLRGLFLVVAWWRLWLLVGVVAGALGFLVWKPYIEEDMLGTCTNGRLFYSGVHANLDNATPDGAPDLQVQGLACPKSRSATETRLSEIGKTLERFGAANETNIALGGIILEHESWPAYVAERAEHKLLAALYPSASLPENSAVLLISALTLHARYRDGRLEKESAPDAPAPWTADAYGAEMSFALDRVLTQNMRESLARLSPAQVATVLLAIEAGKVMAYAFEAGRWSLASRFPQLCARSILHSVAAYSREYNWEERIDIRRAVIYGLRVSAFGPVKFAVDLSPESRAVRQWVELLLACPHNLKSTGDEVELFGIVSENHALWEQSLRDTVLVRNLALKNAFCHGELLFIPLKELLRVMRSSIKRETIDRLIELVETVSGRQRLAEAGTVDSAAPSLKVYERILPPISDDELKSLAANHEVEPADLRDWSALRVVLNAFGWLGRRVGDYAVPESSIVYICHGEEGAFDFDSPVQSVREGVKGVVVLRATRLKDHWGPQWRQRFSNVEAVRMAETPEDYDRILQGLRDPNDLLEPTFGV